MTSVPDQLAKLVEMLQGGFITQEEFESQKRAVLEGSGSSPAPPAGPDPAGRREVGAYRILAFLGEGGMGAVYRGRHRSEEMARRQGGDVAIKVMHAQYARNPEYRSRFEREATVGMRLDHPNVARVHDLIVDGGELALVIQFVPGRPLSDVMGEAAGPLDWTAALALFEPLLDAVGAAHARGVIHRDIKPENVLVSDAGVPIIVDFGIAKDLGSAHTRTGAGMGTVEYMAPEQYTDAGSVDHRADIYSLGMVLYELLAGRLPWEPDTAAFEILEQKARRQLLSPAAFREGIPPEVVAALAPAVAASPDERHASTGVFRTALDQARGRVLEARRRPAGAPAAAASVPQRTPTVVESPLQDHRARPAIAPAGPSPDGPAASRPGRAKPWIVGLLALLLLPIGGVGIWAVVALDRTPRGGSPPTETAVEDEELARIRERERERIQRELDERAAESRAEEGPPGFGVATPQAGEEEPVRAVAEPADRETPISDEELERIRDRERERIQRKLEAQTQLILAEEAEQPKPVSKRASEIDRVWATVSETMKEAEEKPADEEVEVEETSAEDWAFLGEAALGGGNCSGAIGNFREAVRKSPVNANYNYKLGLSYHRCGRDDSAMPYLENAAGSIPAARFLLEEIRSGS